MIPWAHASPQPKRFCRSCTDDRRVSLYFIFIFISPKRQQLTVSKNNKWNKNINTYTTLHTYISKIHSNTQTSNQTIHEKKANSLGWVLIYSGSPVSPLKLPLPIGYLDLFEIHGSLGFRIPVSRSQTCRAWAYGKYLIVRPTYNVAKSIHVNLDYRISGRRHSPGLYPTPYFQFRIPVTRRQTCTA